MGLNGKLSCHEKNAGLGTHTSVVDNPSNDKLFFHRGILFFYSKSECRGTQVVHHCNIIQDRRVAREWD